VVLVPGILRKKLNAATLEYLAEHERTDKIVYFVKSDLVLRDPRLTMCEEDPSVYVGRSTVEEMFLLLSDDRIEHVNVGKKYLPVYR
jgi:hypothetical protein